jgi:hypothetical protein
MVICTRCGTAKENRSLKSRGSGFVEFILWLCGIVPGIVYHIWRGKKVCPACGSVELVPMESPGGRELQQRFMVTVAEVRESSASERSDLRNGYVALLILAGIFAIAFYIVGR